MNALTLEDFDTAIADETGTMLSELVRQLPPVPLLDRALRVLAWIATPTSEIAERLCLDEWQIDRAKAEAAKAVEEAFRTLGASQA